ncbi:MAG TPA: RNA polymerase sigma factor, partial [Nitrosopumilaceae archaeon]|nr:RNA polymerase sigma factor [Nitrosopumilaceae archaeon]
MLAVCLRYCKNREEAEDILQEGFIKVFKNITKFQYQGSFEGWIRRIMVNTALEELRKKRNRMITDDIDEMYSQPKSDMSIEGSINAKDLIGLIQTLPAGYQLVFNLYVIEGYSHKEIAEMLDINEGTSKSQLSKAKGYIQRLIGKSELIKK